MTMVAKPPFKAVSGSWQFGVATAATLAMGYDRIAKEWLFSAPLNDFPHCQGGGNEICELQGNSLNFNDYRVAVPLSIDTPLVEVGVSLLEAVTNPRSKRTWPTSTHGTRTPATQCPLPLVKRSSTHGFADLKIARLDIADQSFSISNSECVVSARQEQAASVHHRRGELPCTR